MTSFWHPNRPGLGRVSRRRVLGAGFAGAGVAFLAGCSARRGGPSGAASSGAGQSKPRTGGQITAAQSEENVSFDPSTKLAASARGNMATCESLLSFKSGPSVRWEELQIQPRLAEKWETPDPQTYIFHLRSGVKWQNLPRVLHTNVEWRD
jgi:peptide/nickel transport system substrate-binding protein